jgi:hypothetical protein
MVASSQQRRHIWAGGRFHTVLFAFATGFLVSFASLSCSAATIAGMLSGSGCLDLSVTPTSGSIVASDQFDVVLEFSSQPILSVDFISHHDLMIIYHDAELMEEKLNLFLE